MRFIRKVLHGEKLGRKLGFPTVNFHVGRFGEHFQTGVYSCIVKVRSAECGVRSKHKKNPWHLAPRTSHLGALYFGPKGTGKNVLEIHILDFSGDLYDQYLTFEVVGKKIRSPKKAKNLEELKAMIEADIQSIRALPESS